MDKKDERAVQREHEDFILANIETVASIMVSLRRDLADLYREAEQYPGGYAAETVARMPPDIIDLDWLFAGLTL